VNTRSLFRLFSSDLAVDLGTANTLIYVNGEGIVLNEPSVVALHQATGKIEAVGTDAKDMLGRTPNGLIAVRPLRDGVVADFKVAEQMLTHFIHKAHKRKRFVHPRIVIGVPSGITQVERHAFLDAAHRAKVSEVYLVEQTMAAAAGAGLAVDEPYGNMVVDIGGGTCDIGLLSLSGVVYSRSLRVAGNAMDDAIMLYVKRRYDLLIGERTAERIKLEVGAVEELDEPRTVTVKGRSMVNGMPKTVTITDGEICGALHDCVSSIIQGIRTALDRTPPELSADISERGIVLTGGVSLLRNLDSKIRSATGLPVSVAEDPFSSVVRGTGKMLEDFKLLRRVCLN
jgi:rod shape-determining protein MreB and related proteins